LKSLIHSAKNYWRQNASCICMRIIFYNKERDFIFKWTRSSNGNLYFFDDVLEKIIAISHKRKYDNEGNWIGQSVFKSEEKIPVFIEMREIAYYR